MPKAVMAVQVIPHGGKVYDIVDQAIAAIARSGLPYEVTPFETVVEGEREELLAVARAAHEACFQAGAKSVLTIIKLAERPDADLTVAKILARYRPGPQEAAE